MFDKPVLQVPHVPVPKLAQSIIYTQNIGTNLKINYKESSFHHARFNVFTALVLKILVLCCVMVN